MAGQRSTSYANTFSRANYLLPSGAGDSIVVCTFIGLDNLHEYLKFSYPKMQAPSFICENESRHGLTLHYRSKRRGFVYYTMGQIKEVARHYYHKVRRNPEQVEQAFYGNPRCVPGDAHRAGVRRVPERHAARDVSAGVRQQSVHVGVDDDDPGGEAPADQRLGAVRNIPVLHRVQVDDKKPT